MAERVSTGGMMTFDYRNKTSSKLKEEDKKEINDAYEKHYEHKRREKKRKSIIWIIVLIILILLALVFLKGF